MSNLPPVTDAPPSGGPDVLDLPRLDKLRALQEVTGQDLLSQVIDLYLRDAPARLEEIRSALAGGDVSAAERLAHSLKGSSSNLGAPAVESVAAELEQLLAQGAHEGTGEVIDRLAVEVDRACRALDELRPS